MSREQLTQELRAKYAHYEKRASELEAQHEAGEVMNGTVINMMKHYRGLANAYGRTLSDAQRHGIVSVFQD